MRVYLSILGLAVVLLGGCSRNIQNQEAVRKGVFEHLSKKAGLDVNSMQIDISSVTFRENEADAVVSFKPKGSTDASAGMQMNYTLERKGNEWVVKGKAGSSSHGAGSAMPGAGSAMPGAGAEMPAGHPPAKGSDVEKKK